MIANEAYMKYSLAENDEAQPAEAFSHHYLENEGLVAHLSGKPFKMRPIEALERHLVTLKNHDAGSM